MILYHRNYLHECAVHILNSIEKSQDPLIVVPEKTHLVQLRKIIAENSNRTIEIPQIYSVEGLEVPSFPIQEPILSRNAAFAVLMEITKQQPNTLPPKDIPTFVRALLGDLPNLYAHKKTPDDLANNIPATISTHKEINLNLCIKVWKEFEIYLKENKQIPYYAKNHILLDTLAKIALKRSLVIIDDFGRSPALQNFITKTKDLPNTAVFAYKAFCQTPSTSAYCIQSKYNLEEKNVALAIKYILSQNEKSKIAIVCEDERIQRNIISELDFAQIPCCSSTSKPAESNTLVRAFLLMLQQNFKELLPLLAIDDSQKYEILLNITQQKPCNIPTWREIVETSQTGDILKIIGIVSTHHFIASKEDVAEFWHFKAFLQSEIATLQTINIPFNKSFILHIASSWKIFKSNQNSSISLCKLRDTHLENYDAIILTSSYKSEPTGNVIFSVGMRKFYGFNSQEEVTTFLHKISTPLFTTGEVPEVSGQPLFLIEEENGEEAYRPPVLDMKIQSNEVPTTLPATWLETLFANPLLFYYKHIKSLNEVPYTTSNSLKIGNTIHWILEHATQKILNGEIFDRPSYISSLLKGNNIAPIFFLEDILQELPQLPSNTHIATETNYSYTIEVSNQLFTLTARADKVETTSATIKVYDYKTGSSTNFEKELKNTNKVQIILPALNSNAVKKIGLYRFIGEGTLIQQEITSETANKLLTKIQETLQRYFFNNEIFEAGKNLYNYYHAARMQR